MLGWAKYLVKTNLEITGLRLTRPLDIFHPPITINSKTPSKDKVHRNLEIIISIVKDMSNWNASICSSDIFAQDSVVSNKFSGRIVLDSTLDQLIVADHTYVQKLNLSGLSGNLASTNASTYLSSQRECYYYNTGWNGMTIYDVSVTINGFYFKFAGSYAAKDGLYEYNYKGHRLR